MATVSLNLLVRRLQQSAEAPRAGGHADEELLDRFLSGDTAAFELLVWRYGPAVLGACRKVLSAEADIEDAFQATFLTLLHDARSIRTRGAVGGWLCGVAHRVAVKVLDTSRRCRQRERRAARAEMVPAASDLSWREACAALHEELDRLPEMYRLPLLLCYLQGLSRDEAAKQLGWSVQSLKGRLERGRQRLRARLVRRGITLSAGLLAVLGDSAVACSVPPRLVQTTLQAAGGRVPASVAVLLHGVTPAMRKGRTKLLAALLFVAVAAPAGVGLTSEKKPVLSARPATAPGSRSAEGDKANEALTLSGRVLGPDGKPVKGASVCLWPSAGKESLARTTTDADGRFRLSVAKKLGQDGTVVAMAEGRCPDWVVVPASSGDRKALTLRLAEDDLPINGRVLTLEGKAIANIPVQVVWVSKNPAGDLTSWIEGVKKGRWSQYRRLPPEALGLPASLTTDREGRIRLAGVGRERLVFVKVLGADNEHARFHVLTRRGPVPTSGGHLGIYPATFDHFAAPGRTASGRVRDKKTGKPLAGITVADQDRRSVDITDKEGRYTLSGLSRRPITTLTAGGSKELPYFDVSHHVDAAIGVGRVSADFEMERGLVINGKLTEEGTGRPLQEGRVFYSPLPGNPNRDEFDRLSRVSFPVSEWGKVQLDGSFSLLGVPGPAVLVPCGSGDGRFLVIDVRKELGKRGVRSWPTGACHGVFEIAPTEKDATSRSIALALRAGRVLAGSVVGPNGKPMAGVEVAGLYPGSTSTEKLGEAGFTLKGLQAGGKRVFIFLDSGRKLGKLQEVLGGEKGPLVVRLAPLGTLTGRVLDVDGQPLAGARVAAFLDLSRRDYENVPTAEPAPYGLLLGLGPGAWHEFTACRGVTDGEGRFRIDGLLPGVPYTVVASLDRIGPGKGVSHSRARASVETGKVRDMGDLKPRSAPN
ncbi:MAG TPA: sigma-70 family RNA polymerase sigma factor [Gemmataceae bacterium]|nr:sigma-70 family RNA polymerase sigma factor [Gemmataceae bacterium]